MDLREIIDEHLIKPIIPKSVYVLGHFQEDHWIIEVVMKDKNQIPKYFIQTRFNHYSITLNARCKRSTA